MVSRNEDYWDGAPPLEAVIFRPITDANTRVAEMLSGGIDVMVEVPPDNVAQFRDDANFKVVRAGRAAPLVPDPQRQGRPLRRQGDAPGGELRGQQAERWSTNVLQGTAEVAAGPTPPAFDWAYDDELEPYPYDPDKAKQLLEGGRLRRRGA